MVCVGILISCASLREVSASKINGDKKNGINFDSTYTLVVTYIICFVTNERIAKLQNIAYKNKDRFLLANGHIIFMYLTS